MALPSCCSEFALNPKLPMPGKLPASFFLQKVLISSWSRARHIHQSCTGFQGVEQDRAVSWSEEF